MNWNNHPQTRWNKTPKRNTKKRLNRKKIYEQFKVDSLKFSDAARMDLLTPRPSRRTLRAISLAFWLEKTDSVSKATDRNRLHNSSISRSIIRKRGQSFGLLTASVTSLKSNPITTSWYPRSFMLRRAHTKHQSSALNLLGEKVMASLAWWKNIALVISDNIQVTP